MADNVSGAVELYNNADSIELPVIVLGEFRFGVAQSRKCDEYETWVLKLIAVSQVLEINEPTTHYYAKVRAELKNIGRPIPTNDMWIAALCRQHSVPLLSRDRHFDAVPGLTRLAW